MKKQIGLMTLSLLLVTPAALAGGAGAPAKAPAKGCKSVAQLIKGDAQLSTLNTAVEAAGLQGVLNGAGAFTVFAPSNAAFAKLPSDKLAALLNDREALRNVLAYHVVGEKATAAQLRTVKGGTTVQGADISVMVHGKGLMVNSAMVTRADLMACNGVVHVIDTVLMPPAMPTTKAPAPTQAPAPAPAPAMMSTPIVIPATPVRGATVSSAAPVAVPVPAPATTTTDTAPAPVAPATTDTANTDTAATDTTATDTSSVTTDSSTATTSIHTLYDVISTEDNYSTFRDLLSDAGMTEELSGDSGEYTVFVPSNAAFEALPEGTLAAIDSDQAALKQFLSYYIVRGKVDSAQLAGDIETMGGKLNLGSAKVGTLVTAGNGNLYPLDVVLLPAGFQVPTVTTIAVDTSAAAPNVITYLLSDARFSTFRSLLTSAELADTLTTGQYTIFAPTDDAFAKMDAEQLTALKKDKAKLTTFLQHYIVSGNPTPLAAGTLTPLGGSPLVVTQDGTTYKVGGASVTGDVNTTGNGNVYVIDTVLLPDAK